MHDLHEIDPGPGPSPWTGITAILLFALFFIGLLFPYQQDPFAHTRGAEAAQK